MGGCISEVSSIDALGKTMWSSNRDLSMASAPMHFPLHMDFRTKSTSMLISALLREVCGTVRSPTQVRGRLATKHTHSTELNARLAASSYPIEIVPARLCL